MSHGSNRRQFLKRAWAGLLLGHLTAQGCVRSGGRMVASDSSKSSAGAQSRFARLKLQTHCLEDLHRFYEQTFGLSIVARSSATMVLRTGATMIEFEQVSDGSKPFYHFAFNIPHNKFDLAKKWLAARSPLLRRSEDGSDEFFFETWNAHAVYWLDPAGNIGELIARHTLHNDADGPFTIGDLLCASEIGLVAPDQRRAADQLCASLQLARYHGSDMFVGDEHGLFVIPEIGRKWFPLNAKPAAVFPAHVEARTPGLQTQMLLEDVPYSIETSTA